MALYRCKLRLHDPLLNVYAIVDNWQPFPKWAQHSQEKLPEHVTGLPNTKKLVQYDKNYLPVEYQYGDLIGLKLREIKIMSLDASAILQSENLLTAFELLVGEKKLIFLEDDLEKIA